MSLVTRNFANSSPKQKYKSLQCNMTNARAVGALSPYIFRQSNKRIHQKHPCRFSTAFNLLCHIWKYLCNNSHLQVFWWDPLYITSIMMLAARHYTIQRQPQQLHHQNPDQIQVLQNTKTKHNERLSFRYAWKYIGAKLQNDVKSAMQNCYWLIAKRKVALKTGHSILFFRLIYRISLTCPMAEMWQHSSDCD